MFPTLITQFAITCNEQTFLGLVPWYHYLSYGSINVTGAPAYCGVKNFQLLPDNGKGSDLLLILLAVVDDLLRIAAIAAIVFVIYGAVQYTTSQGNPDQASKAQSTIVNALLGLALAVFAVGIVSFIGNKLK